MNENSSPSDPVSKPRTHECLPVSPEERTQWVKRFLESGLSIRKFSATHDIPRMTLWKWVNNARPVQIDLGNLSNPQFSEVKLPTGLSRSDWAAELALPNGTVLRLSREVPTAILEQLL